MALWLGVVTVSPHLPQISDFADLNRTCWVEDSDAALLVVIWRGTSAEIVTHRQRVPLSNGNKSSHGRRLWSGFASQALIGILRGSPSCILRPA